MRTKMLALVVLVAGCGSSAPSASPSKCLVTVYFCTKGVCGRDATRVQIGRVEARLRGRSDVYSVRFVSKRVALAIMRRREPGLVQSLPSNPLPDALRIRPVTGHSPRAIASSLRSGRDGVQDVRIARRAGC